MSDFGGGSPAEEFWRMHGITSDPFQLTNSDSEPLLGQYFVPPPFFSGVVGSPSAPSAVAVFAPRGTGKTAQRISVEDRSKSAREYMCITYDRFDVTSKKQLDDVDLDFHLNNLSTRLVLAILTELDRDEEALNSLSPHQRQVVLHASRENLGKLNQQQYSEAISSVKTVKDKAEEAWTRYGGVVASVVTSLLKKVDLDGVTIPSELKQSLQRADSKRYLFEQLLQIMQTLGFKSTYVLIDRVDELTSTSQNSQASWYLVRDLLVNLPILETPGVGFKFFLWDQVRAHFLEEGGRPDRVRTYELEWTTAELRRMHQKRLQAYSSGRVQNFNQLLAPSAKIDAEGLIVHLAAGSPRDMVRLSKAIVDEATKVELPAQGITTRHVLDGIRTFSREHADMVCNVRLPELRKIGTVTFTINQLASDVFNISGNAARSKVQKWQDAGLVSKVDERPNRINRPLHVYAISDPRVAIACSEGLDMELALDNYLFLCKTCDALVISSDSSFRCSECDTVQSIAEAKSLWGSAASEG